MTKEKKIEESWELRETCVTEDKEEEVEDRTKKTFIYYELFVLSTIRSNIEIDPFYVYCDHELETGRSDGRVHLWRALMAAWVWERGSPDRLHRAVFAAVRADFLLRLLWFRSEEKKTTAPAISSRAFVDDLWILPGTSTGTTIDSRKYNITFSDVALLFSFLFLFFSFFFWTKTRTTVVDRFLLNIIEMNINSHHLER